MPQMAAPAAANRLPRREGGWGGGCTPGGTSPGASRLSQDGQRDPPLALDGDRVATPQVIAVEKRDRSSDPHRRRAGDDPGRRATAFGQRRHEPGAGPEVALCGTGHVEADQVIAPPDRTLERREDAVRLRGAA